MIRKAITSLLILLPLTMGAQVMEKYPGIAFTKLSDNGRYLVASSKGVTIFDREEQESQQYGSSYGVGLGNAVSDNGIVVGSASNSSKPGYWQNGEWHDLPHNAGDNVSFAMANGITPDGSAIVGYIDCRSVTRKPWPMVSPVIWVFDDAAGEYRFQMLPEPDKDITGCLPQQVSATFISNDGKTVLGQVTDYRGMLEYQIVYRQDDEGKWTYETSGENRMVKEDAYWPEYPTRPAKPQAADYLTQDEIQAFNDANKAYRDSLEIVDLTGKNPHMPFYEEFIKERKDEYDAAMKQYEKDNSKYVTDLYAFFDAYSANITYHRYEFNSHKLSANGRYYTANYIYPDPDDNNTDINKVKMFLSPIVFDLQSEFEPQVTVNPMLAVYTISDNGCVLAATPKDDATVYSRTAYMIRPGQEPQLFSDWIKASHPDAQKWLEENMFYTVPEGVGQEAGPQVLYGTVRMTPDESKFISYAIDPSNEQYVSYFMDFSPNSAIEGVDTDSEAVEIARYDITGRRLSAPVTGVNIVRYSDGTSRKVIMK